MQYIDEDRVWFKCPCCGDLGTYTVYESYQDGIDFTVDDAPEENIQEMIEGSERGEFQCYGCREFLWLSIFGGKRVVRPYKKNKYR